MSKQESDLPAEAITALWRGNKIEAIRIVRQAWNIDLKEAKDKVDAYVRNEPALQHKLAAAQAETMRGLVRWLLILAVVALLS